MISDHIGMIAKLGVEKEVAKGRLKIVRLVSYPSDKATKVGPANERTYATPNGRTYLSWPSS